LQGLERTKKGIPSQTHVTKTKRGASREKGTANNKTSCNRLSLVDESMLLPLAMLSLVLFRRATDSLDAGIGVGAVKVGAFSRLGGRGVLDG